MFLHGAVERMILGILENFAAVELEYQVSARFARGMSRLPHRMVHHTSGKPDAASDPASPHLNR